MAFKNVGENIRVFERCIKPGFTKSGNTTSIIKYEMDSCEM